MVLRISYTASYEGEASCVGRDGGLRLVGGAVLELGRLKVGLLGLDAVPEGLGELLVEVLGEAGHPALWVPPGQVVEEHRAPVLVPKEKQQKNIAQQLADDGRPIPTHGAEMHLSPFFSLGQNFLADAAAATAKRRITVAFPMMDRLRGR